MSFVIVGHGSIGGKFRDNLKARGFSNKSIFIVDKNKSILNKLSQEGYNCFENIKDIDQNLEIKYGIVSNWGPDHISSAYELFRFGCKRLIIEKPVSNNINDLDNFANIVQENNLFVTVHHHWKYLELVTLIESAAKEYELKNPVGIRLMGGALCLSTNGVHWLDLALEILNSIPSSITADLDIDYINPRDESLAFIGGMSSFRLSNGSFIHISYTNQNSQSGRAEIIYRHGLIDISVKGKVGKLKVYKRKKEDIEKYSDKITRHGTLDLVGLVEFDNKSTVDFVVDDLMNGEFPKVNLSRAKLSLKMIIGAIQSNFENKKISWNEIKDQQIRIS